MGYQTIVRDKLETLGLTTSEAARLCGISGETMSVLAAGWETLPSLALKVAAGLRLTRTETEQIGRVLDAASWRRNVEDNTTGIDFDPEWGGKAAPEDKPETKRKRKKWDRTAVPYLNIRAVSEWAAGRMTSANEICAAAVGMPAGDVTGTRLRDGAKRQELINQVAAAMGLEPEEITIKGRIPTAAENKDVKYQLRLEKMHDAVEDSGKTTARLSKEAGEGTGFLSTAAGRARNGVLFLPDSARRVAKALQVDFYELFEPSWEGR